MKVVLVTFISICLSLAKGEVLEGYVPFSVMDSFGGEPTAGDADLPVDPSSKSAIFEHKGDMTFVIPLPPGNHSDHRRRRRNAVTSDRNLWPNGTIPYQIGSSFDENERRVILMGMKHWEDNTCIRFRPRRSSDPNSIFIMSAQPGECSSYVSRLFFFTQPQGVNLGPNCVTLSTVMHELGHVIGFHHEHNRPDRDQYIDILASARGSWNFLRRRASQSNTLGLGYDYASIMHYGSLGGIITAKSDVPFGNAQELSPLDIEKTRRLYQCGDPSKWPSPSTVVPPKPVTSLPPGETCGRVIVTDKSGSFRFPGYPTHHRNGNCSYVLEVPKGYGVSIRFRNLQLGSSSLCPDEYVRLYQGSSLSEYNVIYFSSFPEGRICRNVANTVFTFHFNPITLHYRTDNSNARPLQVDYTVRDIDECRNSLCHTCTNLPGTFNCSCREGYYHSPAANTCYDVNECAFNNGGCQDSCTNTAGSYTCGCRSGFHLQEDGFACGRSRPDNAPHPQTPGTINSVDFLTTQPLNTPHPTTPFTPPATPDPSIISATCPVPQISSCGGILQGPSGTFNTINWPNEAYPINTDCEWVIECPGSNQVINLSFDSQFKVAGQPPLCSKDRVEVVDCARGVTHGPYCHTTRPNPLRQLGNSARVRFITKGQRGSTRTGFKASYTCVDGPTTLTTTARPTTQRPTTMHPTTLPTTPRPTTTHRPTTPRPTTIAPTSPPATPSIISATCPVPQISSCGGILQGSRGTFNTINWPNEAYPINTDCEWVIECPGSNQVINLSFDSQFKVAGQPPLCSKDRVEVVDCARGVTHGPYCYTTRPNPLRQLGNSARVRFITKGQRGSSRTGFKASYSCVDGPTALPTTQQPTTGVLPTTPHPAISTQPASATTDSASCSLLQLIDISGVPTRLTCLNNIPGGYSFSPDTYPGHLPRGARTCKYYFNGSPGNNYQLRMRYFDFPKGTSCDDINFTVYNGLSTDTGVHKIICSDEPHCGEFVIPLPRNRCLGQFSVSDRVAQSFTGFLAVFEEVP